jgi:hypothetical protein
MRKFAFVFALCFCVLASFAQISSPESFLGYPLGTRFTPHHQVVAYFKTVAAQAPQSMSLQQIGTSYEGRPLLLAAVSSPDNIRNLNGIQQNNLRLAQLLRDGAQPQLNGPAIVWLSYNVHGNEASSTEASMMTLYELLQPTQAATKEWLQRVVVLIDPCLNPDGRDRYVNWYNGVVGSKPQAAPRSREHDEPWPRGRSNHYYFDMNRDWAWQSQTETKARIQQYQKWMPQIHVDFHEQGYNEPYYFAPAAEPFHEVITPFQRSFQTDIGKNHARYFDAKGWLFFTKERFDLFYPSYGDTYPTFNGAIGMTYEQGGIGAGLAVITEDGDTLTLRDRVLHHHTTGLSTIEVSAKRSEELLKAFRTYFQEAVSRSGPVKSYVIKQDGRQTTQKLTELLDRNGIEWGYVPGEANLVGALNYHTGKTENLKASTRDIVIPASQPRANLLSVLMERNSKLSDSATYDITAWSLPYAYGLQAFACKESIAYTKVNAHPIEQTIDINAYAYAIPWSGTGSALCLAQLLQAGVKVRFAEQPFTSAGKSFEKGTLIITKAANQTVAGMAQKVQRLAKESNVELYALPSGYMEQGFDLGSDRVRVIQAPRVAVIAGSRVSSLALGEVWHFFDQQLYYPISMLSEQQFLGSMSAYNVLVLADGSYELLQDKSMSEELKAWVRAGGKIIAMEGAVAQMTRGDWGIKMKSSEEKTEAKPYDLLRKYENRERDGLVGVTPGSIYRVGLDHSHPLAFGYPDYYYTLKQDVQVYEYMKDGWNVGYLKKDNYVAGFAGVQAKDKLKDGLLFGVQEMGRGQVVFLADDVLFRSFWENGKLMFCNAIFMVGQ